MPRWEKTKLVLGTAVTISGIFLGFYLNSTNGPKLVAEARASRVEAPPRLISAAGETATSIKFGHGMYQALAASPLKDAFLNLPSGQQSELAKALVASAVVKKENGESLSLIENTGLVVVTIANNGRQTATDVTFEFAGGGRGWQELRDQDGSVVESPFVNLVRIGSLKPGSQALVKIWTTLPVSDYELRNSLVRHSYGHLQPIVGNTFLQDLGTALFSGTRFLFIMMLLSFGLMVIPLVAHFREVRDRRKRNARVIEVNGTDRPIEERKVPLLDQQNQNPEKAERKKRARPKKETFPRPKEQR